MWTASDNHGRFCTAGGVQNSKISRPTPFPTMRNASVAAQRDFTCVGVRVEAQWVSGLDAHDVVALLAVVSNLVHPLQIAVNPIHPLSLYGQPGPAVDPGAPTTRDGHLHRVVRDVVGQRPQRQHVQVTPVVQAQVDVGVRAVGAPSAAATEYHRYYAIHRHEPFAEDHQCSVVHSGVFDHAAAICRTPPA